MAVPLGVAELKSLKAFNRNNPKCQPVQDWAGLAFQLIQAVSGMGSTSPGPAESHLEGAHWEQERGDLALENWISRSKKAEM